MSLAERLPRKFYTSPEVVEISQRLLGKYLCTSINNTLTAGRIVETEAYRGPDDKASHAYGNRRTHRTEPMFGQGGIAYVYLCYGIHHLFNVVTGHVGMPHAVLVRALEPVEGLDIMLNRRNMSDVARRLSAGPGMLSQALAIRTMHSGIDLTDANSPVWIAPGDEIVSDEIISSPRVGVGYADECAVWPWRFRIRDSPWYSQAK